MTFQGMTGWLRGGYERMSFGMGTMDAWFSGYAATVPGLAGSWLSFMYFGAGLWAVFGVVLRWFPIDIPRSIRPFVLSCLAYFAAIALAAIAAGNPADLPRGISSAAAFLFVPLIISRYRFSDPERSWQMFCTYAPVGAVVGLAAGLFQLVLKTGEISGGAGNANVYAVIMADLCIFSLAGFWLLRGRWQALCVAGYAAAALGVLLSGSRIIYPMIVLAPLLFLYWRDGSLWPGRTRLIVAALALAAIAMVFIGRQQIEVEYTTMLRDVSAIMDGRMNSSLGHRLLLWEASVEAIANAPILGYGPEGKMEAVRQHVADQLSFLTYTHVHNALLDTTIAAGVVGLAAFLAVIITPFMMVFSGPRKAPAAFRFALAAHMLTFMLSGATGALFTHDLLTVMFLMPLVIIAAAASRAVEVPTAASRPDPGLPAAA